MATEEVKLTQQVQDEAVGAGDASGMISRGYCDLQIKETEAIVSLSLWVCRIACIYLLTSLSRAQLSTLGGQSRGSLEASHPGC